MKYDEPAEGEWVQPTRNGYRMMCCDCQLVHELEFRLVKDKLGRAIIQFRGMRNERATARARAAKKIRGEQK